MQNSSLQTTTNELTDNIGIPVKGNFHVEDYIPAGIDPATSNCSQYVRAALHDCKNAGGGTVNIGTLAILLSDVCVPHGVHLRGQGVTATTILVTDTEHPAFKVGGYCAISGLRAVYPNQVNAGAPTPYPPFITHGDNGTAYVQIDNIDLYNAYAGIVIGSTALSCGPIWIRNITGFPLNMGIRLDNCSDVPYLYGIHFNPNVKSDMDPSLLAQVYQAAVAFDFGRVDSLAASSIFALGYSIGLRMRSGAPSGSANMMRVDNFLFDFCRSPIDIQGHQDGIFISNGICTTGGVYHGIPGNVCVFGGSSSKIKGKITLSNISFRSFYAQAALVNSNTEMYGCTFTDYNQVLGEYSAVEINGTHVRLLIDGGGADGGDANGDARPAVTVGGIISIAHEGTDIIVNNFAFKNMTTADIRTTAGTIRVKNNTDSQTASFWNGVPFSHVNGDMATYQNPATFPGVDASDFPPGTRFGQQIIDVGSPKGWIVSTGTAGNPSAFVSEGNL